MSSSSSGQKVSTVLITGCSSGFGKRLVSEFLGSGWRVIATMRHAEERQDIFAEEAKRFGSQLIVKSLDVTSQQERQAIVDTIQQLDDPSVDCLVNNAGYALFGALENCSEAQLREQHDVNLLSPMLLTKAILPFLRDAKGSVINVSSVMSFVGFPLSSAYCSSKAGLTMLSEALKLELSPFGVRVHSVEPGGFRTGFVDNSQWGNEAVSAYESQTSGFHRFQEKLNSGPGKDPAPVIKQIVTLASSRDSALRKQVGQDALFSKMLHKALPESLRLRAMGMMFKRILQ